MSLDNIHLNSLPEEQRISTLLASENSAGGVGGGEGGGISAILVQLE